MFATNGSYFSNLSLPVAHPPIASPNIIAKLDSGASRHYFTTSDSTALRNVRPFTDVIPVSLPNGDELHAQNQGNLPIPHLTADATQTRILDGLNTSLVSVGQLCDDGCVATFKKDSVIVTKNTKVVLQGKRNYSDGLWNINFPASESLNFIIEKGRSAKDLSQYLHASLFSPVLSTLLYAIKNNHLITFPGINDINFAKHLPKSVFTAMGHLDQERSGLQSTKASTTDELHSTSLSDDTKLDFFPPKIENDMKTHECMAVIVPFKETKKAYMDSTGRFPHKSSRGNEYIMIVYDYDSNAILAEPLKNRTAGEMKRAWTALHLRLQRNNIPPKLYILDNEISDELKKALKKYQLSFQLAPPHIHRQNAAERAIRTFKNHFIAGLCSVHPSFPMSEWDRLLHQAELTLNLLRSSRVNPRLSSYAYLFGNFDFNKTPIAPPGSKIVVHLKPDKRASWAPHAENAWYVGPSLDHYRCLRCYIPTSHRTRNCDTVEFFPHSTPIPNYQPEDYIHKALSDIIASLQSRTNIPGLTITDRLSDATLEVARLLGRAAKPPTFVPPAPIPPTSPPPSAPAASVPRVPVTPVQPVSVPRVPVSPSPPVSVPRVPPTPSTPAPIKPSQPPVTLESVLDQLMKSHLRAINHPVRPPLGFRHRQGTPFRHLATRTLAAQHLFEYRANHIYDANGKRETVESLLKGPDAEVWNKSLSNEYGRLAQGNKYGVRSTDTIEFITKEEVPAGRDVTYASFVCDYRPLKSEPYRIRIVVGGDRLSYDDDAGSPATDLLETKILLNSVISDADKGARFMSADLKDHFLASPMERPEYMKIPLSRFPEDIIEQYDLRNKVCKDGYIWIKIKRGMYGLKQAAILAYDHLVNLLEPYGYYPEPHCVGIWSHKTRRTKFCLCVDDFGIKYFNQDDADHLLNALRAHYKISVDTEGKNYCGLTIEWNYAKGYVDISMPGYVVRALHRFQHPPPSSPQYAPHRWSMPAYGQKVQFVRLHASSPLLTKKEDIRFVQSVSGTFLYYGRAVDPTMLVALNEIASVQAKPTEATIDACKMLMDYAHTYPNAKIRYHKSDMILHCESDAAYLVLPNARSRVAAHYFLGNHPPKAPLLPHPNSTNGPIDTLCKALRGVVSSAAEAETGGTFHGAQKAVPMIRVLKALGHDQPRDGTPFKMDNSVSHGFVKSNIKMKRSKTWDMRWHWLRDKHTQRLFRFYWQKGSLNNADYFTKHHPPAHHREQRPKYILQGHHIREKLLLSIQHSFNQSSSSLVARVCSSMGTQIYPKSLTSSDKTQFTSYSDQSPPQRQIYN